jgi:hypothetical protein
MCIMRIDHDGGPIALEVTAVYIGIMSALEGASISSIQSALAAAAVMTGERLGLEGQDLVDWIDTIALRAQAAVLKPAIPTLQVQ